MKISKPIFKNCNENKSFSERFKEQQEKVRNEKQEILDKIEMLRKEEKDIKRKARVLMEMYEDLEYRFGEIESEIVELSIKYVSDEPNYTYEDIGMEEWEIDALFE